MPVPTNIDQLNTTAASNSPAGSDSPIDGDNFVRALASFIAQLRDKLNGTSATGTLKTPVVSGNPSGTIVSGAYTPTTVAVVNISSISILGAYYTRVGDYVDVDIAAVVTMTAETSSSGSAVGSFTATLPIASNFGATSDATGLLGSGAEARSAEGGVFADTAADKFDCRIVVRTTDFAACTAATEISIHAKYKII